MHKTGYFLKVFIFCFLAFSHFFVQSRDFCRDSKEEKVLKAYLKLKNNPSERDYCDFFKALDNWGYVSYFDFKCPALKGVGNKIYTILLREAVKGNKCAIRSYVLSSRICYDEKSGEYNNCVEYLESQYRDFAAIAKNHLKELFDVLLICDKKLQDYVLANLAEYYNGEVIGEYNTGFMRKNIEQLEKEEKYRKFIKVIVSR